MGDLAFRIAGDDASLEDWRHVHNVVIPTVSLTTEDVRERAQHNHLEVAYLNGKLVGNSTVWPPSAETSTARVIARVLREHRRSGFGGLLYERALSVAIAMRAERIGTVVLATNTDGVLFARRRGFMETKRYLLPGDTIPWIELEREAI